MPEELSLMDKASQLAKDNQIIPTTTAFDESKGVEGRVNSITNTNSPLMQTAATKAAQASNARGLNSSTLGIQAGQQAVIETATPIANADAGLFQQQGLANQAAKNAAATTNATSAVTAGVQGMSLDNANKQQDKSLLESARQFDTGQANTQANFGQTIALQNKQVDAQIAQFAQSLGMTVQELQLKRDTLNSSDKQALDQLEFQRAQLNATQGTKQQELALQAKQLDAQIAQFAQNYGLTVEELSLKRDQLSTQDKQALAQLEMQRSQLAQQQSQFETAQGNQAKQFDAELTLKAQQFGLTQQQQTALANLDAATKIKMTELEAQNRSAINGDQNVSAAWGTMMSNIASIQNNSALELGAKTTLIQNTIDSFRGYATYYSKLTGIDVSELLKFEATTAPTTPGTTGDGLPPGPGEPGYVPKPGEGWDGKT